MKRAEQSNYWIGMREDKVMKLKQQGLDITNSYIVNPYEPFIPYKYNNCTELNKLKRGAYFNKALLELRYWGFIEK